MSALDVSKGNGTGLKMKNLWLWSLERFPPVNLLAAILTYLAAAVWARKTLGSAPLGGFEDVAGCAVVFLHLLILRVLDEHKDDAWDRVNHPERVLQRGLITLRDLRWIGGAGLILQTALTIWRAQTAPLAALGWALAWGWTLLMTVEFFGGERLRRRILLYSISHLLLSPFLIVWSALWAAGSWPPADILIFVVGCSFFTSLSYEFARKSKGREEEVAEEPSYSNSFGPWVAPGLIFAASVFLCASKLLILNTWKPEWMGFSSVASAVFLAALIFFLAGYRKAPTKKARKINEGWVTLIGLEVFVTVLCAALN